MPKLNFIGKQIIPTKINKSDKSFSIIRTEDDGETFFVNYGGEKVPIKDTAIKTRRILWSKPCNNQHPAWTKRMVSSVQYEEIVNNMWSPICPNLKCRGTVVNNIFVINQLLVDGKLKEYNK